VNCWLVVYLNISEYGIRQDKNGNNHRAGQSAPRVIVRNRGPNFPSMGPGLIPFFCRASWTFRMLSGVRDGTVHISRRALRWASQAGLRK
jgi:hypothetical protein